MTDLELLELAAKAAGVEVIRSRLDDPMNADFLVRGGSRNPHHELGAWNPLADDGDALRLAVKCGLVWNYFSTDWRCKTGVIEVCVSRSNGPKPVHDEPIRDRSQILMATRRAIVRAAAALAPPQEQQ